MYLYPAPGCERNNIRGSHLHLQNRCCWSHLRPSRLITGYPMITKTLATMYLIRLPRPKEIRAREIRAGMIRQLLQQGTAGMALWSRHGQGGCRHGCRETCLHARSKKSPKNSRRPTPRAPSERRNYVRPKTKCNVSSFSAPSKIADSCKKDFYDLAVDWLIFHRPQKCKKSSSQSSELFIGCKTVELYYTARLSKGYGSS